MIRFTLATALTLGLLTAARAQETPATVTTSAPASASTPAGPMKIGYTNVNYLLLASPQTKVIKSQLETASKQYQKAIEDKQKDFEDKYNAYVKNQSTMMESIRQDKENELRQLQSSIQTLQGNAADELKNRENELVKPELDKIYEAINATAKENGYTFVLNSDQVVLYAADGNDVSDLVLKKLGYPKPKDEPETETVKPSTSSGAGSTPTEKKPTTGGTGRPVPAPKKGKK